MPRNFYGAITGFYEDHATFDIFTSFRAPGGISATIQPTTLMMFLGDTIDDPIPVAYVEVSKLKIGGGPVEAYNQSLRIGNITEWSRLWRRFAFEDELELGVGGEIKVKVGPITVGVDTKKTQKFQGQSQRKSLSFRDTNPARPAQRHEARVGVSENHAARCRRGKYRRRCSSDESIPTDRRFGKS